MKRFSNRELHNIFKSAAKAGDAAATGITPAAMVVRQHASPFDDDSPIEKEWFVSEGACGFAWILIRPGTSRAARFAKKHYGADKHYYGGVSIWVGGYGQSVDRKTAYADAYAEILREHGINAYGQSRLD